MRKYGEGHVLSCALFQHDVWVGQAGFPLQVPNLKGQTYKKLIVHFKEAITERHKKSFYTIGCEPWKGSILWKYFVDRVEWNFNK